MPFPSDAGRQVANQFCRDALQTIRSLRRLPIAEKGASAVDRLQMNSDSLASAQEVLAGLVERVTFHNTESGFCVLRTKARAS